MDKVDKNMDKILFYLNTDPQTNRMGVIEKLDELDKTLTDLIQERKIFKAQATLMGMLGAGLIALVYKGAVLILPFLR